MLCLGGLVAACTSTGPEDSSTPATPVRTTVTTTATPPITTGTATPRPSTSQPTSPSPGRTSSPSTAATGPHACGNGQLAVGHHGLDGATGHSGIVVVFTNTGRTPCTLVGYPGAAVLDAAGTQIAQARRTTGGFLGGTVGAARTVTLRPGGTASARIEGDVGGGDECLRGRALLVTPPNTTRATRIPFEAYSCHVQVHPTVAGTRGGGA